jgi:hypothetical protein
MLLRNFFFHVLDTITQPVLGKFPIKVKIPMNISNSVCSLSDIPKMGPKMGKVSRFQQRSSQSVRSHIIFSIIFKLENIVFVRFLLMIQLKTFVTGWQHCIRPQRNHWVLIYNRECTVLSATCPNHRPYAQMVLPPTSVCGNYIQSMVSKSIDLTNMDRLPQKSPILRVLW